MNIKVLLQAFNSIWFIEPSAAEHYALVAHQFLIGERKSFWDDDDDDDDECEDYAYAVDASGKRIGSIADAVDNGVAVINLRGAVMKYDYCGSPGTQSLKNALQQANDNPAISAIVFQIDSPGGSVDGTEQLASAIKNSAKPVIAFANGMMCSAAMWIGSAASERIASSNTDTIGSIGTMAAWKDFKGYYEKIGIKSHEVYATASTQKNLPFREAQGNNAEGKINYEPLIKIWLDPTNDAFMNAIQENLPAADKTVLSGAAYIASDAKKKGLIDRIGTFQDAVNAALKLAKSTQQTQTFNTMKFSEKFPKLAGILGVSADIATADIKVDNFLLQCEALEAVVNERDANTQTIAAHAATIATQTASNTTLTADKAALTTKVQNLEALDGGKITTTSEEKDTNPKAECIDANEMSFQKDLYANI